MLSPFFLPCPQSNLRWKNAAFHDWFSNGDGSTCGNFFFTTLLFCHVPAAILIIRPPVTAHQAEETTESNLADHYYAHKDLASPAVCTRFHYASQVDKRCKRSEDKVRKLSPFFTRFSPLSRPPSTVTYPTPTPPHAEEGRWGRGRGSGWEKVNLSGLLVTIDSLDLVIITQHLDYGSTSLPFGREYEVSYPTNVKFSLPSGVTFFFLIICESPVHLVSLLELCVWQSQYI